MGLVGDTACVLATQSVFFLIGWIFFVKKLFKDYELRHYLVQVRTSTTKDWTEKNETSLNGRSFETISSRTNLKGSAGF